MPAAPLPPNESRRLEELLAYRILDTERESGFDEIAQLAALVCRTPIAAITFIDRKRQWFKASVGLSITETIRDLAFCAYTVHATDLLQVEDATVDARFADNPMVCDDPCIRFYAGAPIVTEQGNALGAVCVLDHVRRSLDSREQASLEALARLTLKLMNLRREGQRLSDLNRQHAASLRNLERSH